MVEEKEKALYNFMGTLTKLELPEYKRERPNIVKIIKCVRTLSYTIGKLNNTGPGFGLKEAKDYTEKWCPEMWHHMVYYRVLGKK